MMSAVESWRVRIYDHPKVGLRIYRFYFCGVDEERHTVVGAWDIEAFTARDALTQLQADGRVRYIDRIVPLREGRICGVCNEGVMLYGFVRRHAVAAPVCSACFTPGIADLVDDSIAWPNQ